MIYSCFRAQKPLSHFIRKNFPAVADMKKVLHRIHHQTNHARE